MKTYCVSYKKNTSNKNSGDKRTKQNSLMLVSNCAIYREKNWFIKNQGAIGLLSKFGIRAPLSHIPLTGDILF